MGWNVNHAPANFRFPLAIVFLLEIAYVGLHTLEELHRHGCWPLDFNVSHRFLIRTRVNVQGARSSDYNLEIEAVTITTRFFEELEQLCRQNFTNIGRITFRSMHGAA
jgi:hypothetical protein